MGKARAGFTLIELLVVVVILGVLATVAIPKFNAAQRRAFVSTMTQDLRNLSVYQQILYDTEGSGFTFTIDLADLPGYTSSDESSVFLEEGDTGGWSARVQHVGAPGMECVVYYGSAAPITTAAGTAPGGPGSIACDDPR